MHVAATVRDSNAIYLRQLHSKRFRLLFRVAENNGRLSPRESLDEFGHVTIQAFPEHKLVLAYETKPDDMSRKRYRAIGGIKCVSFVRF